MKILLDTNAVFELFRDDSLLLQFDAHPGRPLMFLSSIVAMEMRTGCRTAVQERSLDRFLRPFDKARRIIVPDHATCMDAGRVLARIGAEGANTAEVRRLVSDAMIAASAVRAGLLLITKNGRDFARIARHIPLRWLSPAEFVARDRTGGHAN